MCATRPVLVSLLLLFGACAQSHLPHDAASPADPDMGPPRESPCRPEDYVVRAEEATAPIDIVWAIPDLCSWHDIGCHRRLYSDLARVMAEYWEALESRRTDALSVFVAPPGLVVSPPPPLSRRVRRVPVRLGEDGLVSLLNTYSTYERWLRSDSELHLVVVSVHDAGWEPDRFVEVFRELAGRDFTFHAVVGTSEDARFGCPTGFTPLEPGTAYREIARRTGGLDLSICTSDWSDTLAAVVETAVIRRPLPCEYTLPQPPPLGFVSDYDPSRFEVSLVLSDGAAHPLARQPGAASCGSGWWYFEGGRRIVLCPTTCELAMARGEELSVDVGCPAARRR